MHQNAEPRLRGVDWLARLLYANMQITTPSIIPILRDIIILNVVQVNVGMIQTQIMMGYQINQILSIQRG